MHYYVINIGLNNNPYSTLDQVKDIVDVFNRQYCKSDSMDILSIEQSIGKWDGADEPTAVMLLESTLPPTTFRMMIKALCTEMTQDCIPFVKVIVPATGFADMRTLYEELVYNRSHLGDVYDFSYDYFIFPSYVKTIEPWEQPEVN
jgi:hypothetical protein